MAEEAAAGPVQPIYISVGLAWEAAERAIVSQFLAHPSLKGDVRPLVSLSVDMRDVYAATHWAMTGHPPAYDTPDEDVYLPGRNIVLFGKAGRLLRHGGIGRLTIGTLAHNPFPDATPEFRATMARALSLGLDRSLSIDAPYANHSKAEVIRRGAALGVPFQLTLSCMNPPALSLSPPPSAPSSTAAPAANAASATTPSSRPGSPIRHPTRRTSTTAEPPRFCAVDSPLTSAYRARVMRAAEACDVLVVGGGPAGSTAAQLLASWGWSVTLVHRAASRPALAESLPSSTRKLLGFLGQLGQVDAAAFFPTTATLRIGPARPVRPGRQRPAFTSAATSSIAFYAMRRSPAACG